MLPSAMLGLTNSWISWCFDHALATFGRMIENKLKETDKSGKRKWSAQQVFDGSAFGKQAPLLEWIAASGGEMDI